MAAKKKTIKVEEKIFTIKIKGEDASFTVEKFTTTDVNQQLLVIEKNQLSGPEFSKLNLSKKIAILNIYIEEVRKEYGNI